MGLTSPRRYWLTGAGNGIGASLAESILRTGAHLAVSSRLPCEAFSAKYPGQVLIVAGNLTDSQAVREAGERIAREWGALDTVIINAGTAEYISGHPVNPSIVEHIVRSNLLAASLCIEAASPLLRAGNGTHLVGIASPLTYLPPSQFEAGDQGMRYLFESARGELARDGIDVTIVHPGFDNSSPAVDGGLPPSVRWSAETAAQHILTQLTERPLEVILPAMTMNLLWPLPSNDTVLAGAHSRSDSYQCPIKGHP